MNLTRFLAPVLALSMLSGCASITRSQFAGDQTYTALDAAMKTTSPIGDIKFGDARRIRIDATSPLMDTPAQRGRFESVTINGRKGSNYQLTIAGVCDCLGFRKWSVAPKAFLFNDRAELIAEGTQVNPQIQTLLGKFPEDGIYRILVIADDSRTGERLSSVQGGVPAGAVFIPNVFTIPVSSHPTGIVSVSVQ